MLNDLGLDPNEWFDDVPHPHDVMPIATYIENDGSTGPLIPPPDKRKDPPYEMNGNGRPLTGINPTVIEQLTKMWPRKILVMPIIINEENLSEA